MTTWAVMADVPNPIIVDAAGTAGSGYVLKAYLPGTTTSTSIAINSSGGSPQTSITANAEGKWEVSGNEILPYIDRTHKWGIFANAVDAAANTPFYMGPFDNVGMAGLADYDTIAALKLLSLTAGMWVQTKGYYTAGDGAGGTYWIDTLANHGAADGYGDHALANGNIALLQTLNGVNVKQYGAKGDSDGTTGNGTDDTAAIQSAVDAQELAGGGEVYFPLGAYRITAPIVNDLTGVSFIGSGASVRGEPIRTALFLDSFDAGDYAIKLAGTNYMGRLKIADLGFIGTNNANNQGAVLIAGRASSLLIEMCVMSDFTGYAIGRDPSVTSYTQNNTIRDVGFFHNGGAYGLISDPADAAGYLAETLLTIDNVNVDHGLNDTDVKPYVWDFRGSRNIECGIILTEGLGVAGVTAVMAFATDAVCNFEQVHIELTVVSPTYSMIILNDAAGKFSVVSSVTVKIGYMISSAGPIRFEAGSALEGRIIIDDWFKYSAVDDSDIVSFAGEGGHLEVKRLEVKAPWKPEDALRGRLVCGFGSADDAVHQSLTFRELELASWSANDGLLTDLKNEHFVVTSIYASEIIADGDLKVHKFTGAPTVFPVVNFNFTHPAAWEGAYIVIAIKYKTTVDGADPDTTVRALYSTLSPQVVINGTEKNGAEYVMGYINARLDGGTIAKINTRHLGVAPTVAGTISIAAIRVWLGVPDEITLPPSANSLSLFPGGGTPRVFTSTDATPSVYGGEIFKTAGTTPITDFDDGVLGQTITILATASITITDGAPIILAGGANFTMVDTDTLTLTMFNDQVWSEVARSVN